jgi:hypothetical protein
MKPSDIIWVQSLAQKCLGRAPTKALPMQVITQSMNLFLDELCALMTEYSSYFNELVREEHPETVCNVFRLGSPRPGLMLLRGKDKLVIASEGSRIRCRVVQVHAYNERVIDAMEFEGMLSPEKDVVWVCLSDNQRVTPELVSKLYLGKFLAQGCPAFEIPRKSVAATSSLPAGGSERLRGPQESET